MKANKRAARFGRQSGWARMTYYRRTPQGRRQVAFAKPEAH